MIVAAGGSGGVREKPFVVLNEAFSEIAPATVPVWKRAELELSLNTA